MDVPSRDGANSVVMQCPVCDGPMQVINVESPVPGVPADMERRTIRCSVCELVAIHVFAREDG
jgi:hypothetical protein